MKHAACALLAGMCALFLTAAAERAQDATVELRGTAGAAVGVLLRVGPDGIALRVDRGGIQREELFPWSEVRECTAGSSANGTAQWLTAGEALWRGRSRAMRGDWELALQPLTAAAQAWRGQAPTPDGLAAALGATAACVRAGRSSQALPYAFEAMRLLRAGVAPPDWARDGLAAVDAPRGIPTAVAPMALTGDAAVAAAKELRALSAPEDPAIEQSAQLYAALLDGTPAPAPKATKQSEETRQGLTFLGLLRDTRADTPAARAAARRNLAALRRSLPAWSDAWVRFALGVSLAMESDAPARERAAILLLSVDAVDRSHDPVLAAAARERAATILTGLGSTAHAPQQQTQIRPEDVVPRDLADIVATHLDELGHSSLLATHLETQLEIALTDEDRANIVSRLALLLAGELEAEPDAARRDALLARSTRIVDRFDNGSEPLRLVLLRAQHRAAQRVAEDRRAGRVLDAAAAAAAVQFRTLARGFDTLTKRADAARLKTENEISRAAGLQAELLAERSNQQDQVARSAQFFQAWALYYQAWLQRELKQDGWRDVAEHCSAAFARLIEPGKAAIEPSEVSMDLRSNEGFASAILGSALVSSMTQSGSTADSWLALLESPGTHESVRLKLPAWRMASLLDRPDYERALELLRAEGDGPQGSALALIAAARAARDADAVGSAELLTEAVARIAGAGKLADLAAMTGVAEASRNGAGAGLFEGVRLAARAQRAQQEGKSDEARALWSEAAKALETALGDGAPNAIISGARSLQGWALRGAGRPGDAADAFIASAKGATGDRAGDAMWNAVLCLDEAARKGDAEAGTRADAVADQVARDYPGTAAAVRAHAWRVVRMPTPDAKDIEALLAPSVSADLAPAARRAAFEGLYRRFRALTGAERATAARRALMVSDADPAAPGDDGTADLRKRLEMAVAVDDRSRASQAFAAIEARAERSEDLARALAEELAARRAQIAALDRRAEDAVTAARAVEPTTPWGRVAWRAARDAVARDPSASPGQRAQTARSVAMGWPSADGAPADDLVRWAMAEAELLRTGGGDAATPGDPDGAQRALAEARKAKPRNSDLALADADLRMARGDRKGAEDVLRTLLAGLQVGAPAWFEAKVLNIQLLAADQPAKARALLEQVRQLAGGFGTGASAAALAALDRELPRSEP